MKKVFEMTDTGHLKFFLALEVVQTKKGLLLKQEKYAESLLKKFGHLNCNIEETPMNASEKLKLEDGAGKVDEQTYRNMVGGLIYLTHTRPDLTYSVSLVTRFMQSPSKIHYGAAK